MLARWCTRTAIATDDLNLIPWVISSPEALRTNIVLEERVVSRRKNEEITAVPPREVDAKKQRRAIGMRLLIERPIERAA
jgi:hypothetical protein